MLPYHNRRIFRSPIQRSEENKKWNVSILHKTSKIKNFIYLLLRILADDLGKGFNIRGDLADFDVLPRDKSEVVDCPMILSENNNLIISHEVLKLFFYMFDLTWVFWTRKTYFLIKTESRTARTIMCWCACKSLFKYYYEIFQHTNN